MVPAAVYKIDGIGVLGASILGLVLAFQEKGLIMSNTELASFFNVARQTIISSINRLRRKKLVTETKISQRRRLKPSEKLVKILGATSGRAGTKIVPVKKQKLDQGSTKSVPAVVQKLGAGSTKIVPASETKAKRSLNKPRSNEAKDHTHAKQVAKQVRSDRSSPSLSTSLSGSEGSPPPVSVSPSVNLDRQALFFIDSLNRILRSRSRSDRTCFANVTRWLTNQCKGGKFNEDIFSRVLEYAAECTRARNPPALFMATIKRELGYVPQKLGTIININNVS